jgi:threonine aldolase
MIDLRSDTVTKPTAAMRRAMMEAEVGDDVYGEDPTVNRLERRAAEILGKEAALFVPTGSMGNAIAIKLHTHHGEEVICDHRAHILDWELGMPAWFSGCVLRTIPTEAGILRWEDVRAAIRPRGGDFAPAAMVHLENTHNMGGGTVYPLAAIQTISDGAHQAGLKVHLDGARIFNAALASGEAPARIAAPVDTVMFCLSKGLGAPVGSMLAGSAQDMARARHYRKALGGGMRQAGVLAAAGLVALEETPPRLAEDHANARLLAERLAALPGIALDPSQVRTNIVIFDVGPTGLTPQEFCAGLEVHGVRAGSAGGSRVRLVTHYDVSRAECERAVDAIADLLAALTSASLGVSAILK